MSDTVRWVRHDVWSPSLGSARSASSLGLVLAWTFGLALFAPLATRAENPTCEPVTAIDELLGPGRVVLLGEIHGTNEAPEFVASIVCQALADDLRVTVALELPFEEEPAVREFVDSRPLDAGVVLPVDLPFWSKPYQDGRTSMAMLALIEQVRERRLDGEHVEIILIDRPAAGNQRDDFMAERLLEAVSLAPERFIVALTGNLHNRTSPGSGRMGERLSNALGRERVTSLNMAHAGGSAWICEATQGCGPFRFEDREADPAGRVVLFTEPDPRGYDGVFTVGKLSPSRPAQEGGR